MKNKRDEIRVGMVGLDTSHCPAFTGILNDASHDYHVPGARVIAAYPGGSEQFSLSRDRVAGFTETLTQQYGVTLYDSIAALAEDVDAILLESVDGRQHLEQVEQMAIGKPIFIDKPLTTSVDDARALIEVARQTDTPIMSSSSLRYAAGIADLLDQKSSESDGVVSCEAFGPAPVLEDYPGLFWYGVHSAEVLFAFMGKGCARVRAVPYREMDVAIGEWEDGRLGLLRGTRFAKGRFGCVVHTATETHVGLAQSAPPYYYLLLQQVMEFFKTGVSPIDIEETFNVIAFLAAADQSKAQGGAVVSVETL
jgi:hypothetical protein